MGLRVVSNNRIAEPIKPPDYRAKRLRVVSNNRIAEPLPSSLVMLASLRVVSNNRIAELSLSPSLRSTEFESRIK